MRRPRIGFDIPSPGDLLDAAKGAVKAIPGGDWIVTAVSDGADWVGNAAKTPAGVAVLQVITSGLASSLSAVAIPSVSGMQTVGPVISSVVFALPGVVAGKDFLRSYVEEFTARVVATAAVLSANPGLAAALGTSLGAVTSVSTSELASRLDSVKQIQKAFSDQILKVVNDTGFRDAITKLGRELGLSPDRNTVRRTLRNARMTAPELAKKYGVRPDAAATAINGGLKIHAYGVGAPSEGQAEFDVLGRPNRTYENSERNSGGNPERDLEPIPGEPLGGLKPPAPVLLPSPSAATLQVGSRVLQIIPSSRRGIFSQLAVAALLTSPAWLPWAIVHRSEIFPSLRRSR